MSPGPVVLIIVSAIALLTVPRRWAPLPFILTACYLSMEQAIELGPFTFSAIRLLVAIGVVRIIVRGERLAGGMNGLDWWIVAFASWAVVSGFFHENPAQTFNNRLGLIYNTLGIYGLLRVFCSSIEDVVALSKATAILLLPVALEMMYEAMGNPSLFYIFEGNPREIYIRRDRIRAMGPFLHPILAGTVGGVTLPLVIGMWHHRRKAAYVGIFACLGMVVSSASSGPLMSVIAGSAALAAWPLRHRMKTVRRAMLAFYVLLALAMKAPVYYLIARINFVDGSTGYHRALIIESAVKYFNEWWLAGTDLTRHWAPSPGFTPQHTDITNQYLSVGILGGIPLMILFIGMIVKAFSLVGTRLQQATGDLAKENQVMLWALGSALFSHMITFLSVSYFDQSFLFFYVALAAIGSARVETQAVPAAAPARAKDTRIAGVTPIACPLPSAAAMPPRGVAIRIPTRQSRV